MPSTLPCVLMRGGTSRGPVFRREWLPEGPELDRTLLAALGSPHALQVDGLGGADSLTSKVAIVSRSARPGCDVDYLFAQVGIDEGTVDWRPNCGNMLSAAAPFAIEQAIVPVHGESTRLRVHNVNTGALIDVTVRTPGGAVTYEGEARIDGVSGTAAPVNLSFVEAGRLPLLPSGVAAETIDGVRVTCLAAAMPIVAIRAESLGLAGDESPERIDADAPLLARIERIRREAGRRMGLGEVAAQVTPKVVLLAPGPSPLSVRSRYLTPWRCHRSHAVTGAIAVATAFVTAGTLAAELAPPLDTGTHVIEVCHPAGRLAVALDCVARDGAPGLAVESASLVRTARKILAGELFLP